MSKRRVVRHEVVQPLNESYRLIPLTRGQNAIVDVADFEWLDQWNWHAWWDATTNSFYAMRNDYSTLTPVMLRMHRVILACNLDEMVDHQNHNTLDNRRNNIRKCSGVQNAWNRRNRSTNKTGYKGVSFRKDTGRWRAGICAHLTRKWLGNFTSAEDAARAYDEAARRIYGEFAVLNFP